MQGRGKQQEQAMRRMDGLTRAVRGALKLNPIFPRNFPTSQHLLRSHGAGDTVQFTQYAKSLRYYLTRLVCNAAFAILHFQCCSIAMLQ